MADIAHEHQAATGQGDIAVFAVSIECAGHRSPTFVKRRDQIAAHQTQPISVGCNLILGVHRRD